MVLKRNFYHSINAPPPCGSLDFNHVFPSYCYCCCCKLLLLLLLPIIFFPAVHSLTSKCEIAGENWFSKYPLTSCAEYAHKQSKREKCPMSYPFLSLAVKFTCRPLFFVALRQNRYLNIEGNYGRKQSNRSLQNCRLKKVVTVSWAVNYDVAR